MFNLANFDNMKAELEKLKGEELKRFVEEIEWDVQIRGGLKLALGGLNVRMCRLTDQFEPTPTLFPRHSVF